MILHGFTGGDKDLYRLRRFTHSYTKLRRGEMIYLMGERGSFHYFEMSLTIFNFQIGAVVYQQLSFYGRNFLNQHLFPFKNKSGIPPKLICGLERELS